MKLLNSVKYLWLLTKCCYLKVLLFYYVNLYLLLSLIRALSYLSMSQNMNSIEYLVLYIVTTVTDDTI